MAIDPVHYNLPGLDNTQTKLSQKLPKGNYIDRLTPATYLNSAYYLAAAYAISDFTQNNYLAIPFMLGSFLSFYKTLSKSYDSFNSASGKGA